MVRFHYSIVCGLTIAMLVFFNFGCSALRKSTDSTGQQPAVKSDFEQPLARLSPNKERQLQIDTARRLAANGHAGQAVKLFLKAEEASPLKPKLNKELAPLLADLGQFDAAVERYQREIKDRPNDLDLRNNYGWTLIEANRLDEAESALRKLLEVDPQNSRAKTSLAICEFHRGNLQSAFEQMRSIQGEPAALHNIALLCIEKGDWVTARRWLDRAMNGNPLPATKELLTAVGRREQIAKAQ